MEMYHGGGGRMNPDFSYKVRVKKPFDGMIEWCNEYPVIGTGHFQRYYVDFRDGTSTFSDTHAVFQFELEEHAIMFALRWQ